MGFSKICDHYVDILFTLSTLSTFSEPLDFTGFATLFAIDFLSCGVIIKLTEKELRGEIMIPLNMTLNNMNSVTLLSNSFIDTFMKDANDTELKIYLYLLRMVSSNLPTDIAEIADKFNNTEKDVIRSLKYWESKKVMSLEYDNSGNITGISFNNISDITCECDTAPTGEMQQSSAVKTTIPVMIKSENSVVPSDITMISMDYAAEKNSYSADDIKKLMGNKEIQMLIHVTSQYFGRTLNANEIRTLLFIYDRLNFTLELEIYLIDYCVDHNQNNIHYIETVAINWYEEGIDDISVAKKLSKKVDTSAYTIMAYLGKSSTPTGMELEYIRKWTGVYCFSLPIIENACQRAVMATDKNRFQYADSILKSWYGKGVKTKKDIAALDADYEASKVAVPATKKLPSKQSNFCKMEKHNYDTAELEKALTQ